MPVTVHIPTPLRPDVGGRNPVATSAGTVGEILERLAVEHAQLRAHLYRDDGRLRSFVNVYLNDRDIRDLAREATRAADGDEVCIVPSIAGGAAAPAAPAGAVDVAAALPELSHAEILRYSRHLILPGVGPRGERRIQAARV